MPEANGPPAVGNAASDEEQRVSTAALLAAVELLRGMSDHPAATPPKQLLDDLRRQRSARRSSRTRSRPCSMGSCRCATTPTST
jgi:hypothetical protein